MAEQLITTVTVTELIEVSRRGPPGPPGPAGSPGGALVTGTAGAALSGHMAVAYDAAGDLVYASADEAAHAWTLAGVTTGAAAAGDEVTVQRNDVIEHGGWAWTPQQLVFLGLGGVLTQSLPPGAAFCSVLGVALSPTRLMLQLQPPIFIT